MIFSDPVQDPRTAWARHLGKVRDVDSGAFEVSSLLADVSLPRLWSRRWGELPTRPVLRSSDGAWVTAEDLEGRTRRRAGILAALGVQPGDRVLCSLESSLELVEWHVGALRAGAVVVPTNPAYRQRELSHVARDAEPRVVIADGVDRAAWAGAASPRSTVLDPTSHLPDPVEVRLDGVGPDDPAMLPYTSGTTGVPKGALLTHGNLLSSVVGLLRSWRWDEEDVLVLALPLFHMHGLGVGLHGTLAAGASALLHSSFDAARVLDEISEGRATLFFGVPTMYARLGSVDAAAMRRLRLCVSGSAPLPAELFQRIKAQAGQRVLERYGMTETVMNLSNPYDGERRPGTVGFALPGVEVRLANGQHGEIELRGPNVFRGYWRRESSTAEAFTADGWFRSGDLAEIDQDGYHRIVGRSKELIISGGYNVYPREIEDVLLEMPGISEAAVVGLPSDEWGEVVAAYLVSDAQDEVGRSIDAYCAQRLAPYKRPRIVRFVDELPRNALGKILRDLLREDPTPSSDGVVA